MKKLQLLLFLSLFTLSGIAQTITVKDKFSENPIPNAVIVNCSKSISVQTDDSGEVSLNSFSDNEVLRVIHTSYANIKTDKTTITDNDYIIYLTPEFMKLEETVIAASRRIESKSDIPYRIVSINMDDINIYEPQTSADILSASREVFVQKSQMGGGSPMIRGFSSNRVLLVVDGVRMNNAIYRHGNLHNVISLDANSIEGVEVIYGPGSVMYGSDAIGGVFSFNTKSPSFTDGEIETKTNTMLRYSSANFEKTGSLDFSIANDKWASLTLISFSDYDDLVAGKVNLPDSNYLRRHSVVRKGDTDVLKRQVDRNVMTGTGYNFVNVLQKLKYKLSDNIVLEYGLNYSETSDIPRFDRLNIYDTETELRFAEWHYGPQKWLMNNLQASITKSNTAFDELRINFSHQNYQESRHSRRLHSDERTNRFENVNVFTANFDFYKDFRDNQDINYGIEAVYNEVGSSANIENVITGEKKSTSTRYPDGSNLMSGAAYLSYKYYLNNRFTFTGGGRYTHTIINADMNSPYFDFPFSEIYNSTGAPTFTLGAIYKQSRNLNMSLNLSTGFRSPNIDDIAKVFDSEPYAVVVPNENLGPEYIYSADFNIIKNINKKLELEFSGFYSYLDNIMVRDDFTFNGQDSIIYDGVNSKVQSVVNKDHAIVYGVSGGVNYRINDIFRLRSDITWMQGKDNNEMPIRHVSPVFGSTHLIITLNDFVLDINTVYNGEISPENLSPEEHGKFFMYAVDQEYAKKQEQLPADEQFNPLGLYSPSWHTININMSYELSDRIQFNAGIQNINNILYRPYSSGIPAFGRNYVLGFRGSF